MRKLFLGIFLLLIFPGFARAQSTKPNFVIIIADDLGYGDVGVYGQTKIKTPNIDKLAAQGLKFTDFYANSSVCCPTRASFFTGRYSKRVGIDEIIQLTGASSTLGIASSEVTLPEAVRPGGYSTKLVGKWHLGHQSQFNPTLHGFDSFYGVLYSNNYSDGLIPLYRDTSVIESQTDQRYLTSKFTQEAVGFVDTHKTQPFFLVLSYTAPHVPLFANPGWVGKSAGGMYGDVVEEMDWGIGQVVAKLDQLSLSGNTLVFFVSDNGPSIYNDADGGSPGPLYCGKGSYFEGGIRVPAIARWPGKISPGSSTITPAVLFDLYPTLIKLAGLSLPTGKVMDGHDIGSLLFGTGVRPDDDFGFTWLGQTRAVRMGKWKLLTQYSGGQAWMDECGAAAHPVLLYNLDIDPGEKTNLASQFPKVASFLNTEAITFQSSLASSSNHPPIARFTAVPSASNPRTITFNASPSTDKEGSVSSYNWDFGDNSTGTGSQPLHTYAANGTYTVTLRVTDGGSLSDGTIQDMVVSGNSITPTKTPTKTPTPSTSKPGDANGDNLVNGLDYLIWLSHFGQNVSGPVNGDFNNNGVVNGADYLIWLSNYGL